MNVSYILEKNSLLLSYDMNMWEYMLKVTLKYIHVLCVLYETKLDIKTPEHPNPYIMTGKLKVAPLARISLMQVLN